MEQYSRGLLHESFAHRNPPIIQNESDGVPTRTVPLDHLVRAVGQSGALQVILPASKEAAERHGEEPSSTLQLLLLLLLLLIRLLLLLLVLLLLLQLLYYYYNYVSLLLHA